MAVAAVLVALALVPVGLTLRATHLDDRRHRVAHTRGQRLHP